MRKYACVFVYDNETDEHKPDANVFNDYKNFTSVVFILSEDITGLPLKILNAAEEHKEMLLKRHGQYNCETTYPKIIKCFIWLFEGEECKNYVACFQLHVNSINDIEYFDSCVLTYPTKDTEELVQDITLPIPPTAQKRARHVFRFRKNVSNIAGMNKKDVGFSTTYHDKGQMENEGDIMSLLQQYIPEEPYKDAIRIEILANFPVPKTTLSKKKEVIRIKERGGVPRTKKPDADNLSKQILDCMTKLGFWLDDKQVFDIRVIKKDIIGTGNWQIKLYTVKE